MICRRNHPIAEVRALPVPRTEPRPIGLAAGDFELMDAFFKPLPEEVLRAFTADTATSR